MKRIALFMAIAIAAIACKPEEKITPKVTVNTDEATLVIPTKGGDVQIVFESNVEWTAALKNSADANWCTITPAKGDAGATSVKVIALENQTNENRTATVVITAQTAKAEVTVTQLQKDALVLAGDKTFEVPAEGGEVSFTVSHNVDLKLSSDSDWLVQSATRGMTDSKIVFNAAENTGAARTGKITVSAGDLKEEITVNQAAWVPVFEVSPTEEQWIALEGGSVTINVNANIGFTVTPDENDWLTVTNEGGAYTFTASANSDFSYRSLGVYITPTDEAYIEYAKTIYIFQSGRATTLWTANPTDEIDGFDASLKTRLAKYGDKIILANTTKIFVLDAMSGDVVNIINLPEGFNAHSVLTDDAGNLLLGADVAGAGDLKLFHLPDPANPEPVEILTYNTGNYYGTDTGNFRVRGDIKSNAVITATVSDGAGGAALIWEVVDGVCSDWTWTNVPYAGSLVAYACCAPAGATLADGLFYIGYGGDYNLYYNAEVVKGGASTWALSYTTGSSWMENYNCISTAEWNGNKYAAVLKGCHFNYDDADAVLLNVDDPAAASHIYTYAGTYDVERDDAWANLYWTGLGTNSDILLVPTDEALLMVYVDANFGSMACIAVK